MKLKEALDLVKQRNGRPHEDDWELIDAAEAMSAAMHDMRQALRDIKATLSVPKYPGADRLAACEAHATECVKIAAAAIAKAEGTDA